MKKMIASSVLLGLLFGFAGLASGAVRINEICADNDGSFLTQAGKAEDWVELYNDSAAAVDLTGWHLTDNLSNLTKWSFPAGASIPAYGYLIVFADSAEQPLVNGELHTSFAFSKDGESIALVQPDGVTVEDSFTFGAQLEGITYGYLSSGDTALLPENAPVQYTIPNSVNNGPTLSGTGGLGFASAAGTFESAIGTDIGTAMKGINTRVNATYTFTLGALPAATEDILLLVRYSDGFRATLNGAQFATVNMPSQIPWNAVATASRPMGDILTWQTFTMPKNYLWTGMNTLAITALNNSVSDGNFLIQPKVVLSSSESSLRYFKVPTPGAANAQGYNPPTPRVSASEPRGYKRQAFTTALTCEIPGAPIYYTLNGSTPSASNGTLYTVPLTITGTTTLRAAAIDPNAVWQNVDTVTYLFLADIMTKNYTTPAGWPASGAVNGHRMYYGMDQTIVNNWGPQIYQGFTNEIPTLSIVTDLPNLFSPQTGIYVNPVNDGREWERPMSLELIDPVRGSAKEFQINAGLRIRGGHSRNPDNPRHSLRVFFRSEYGAGKLNFPLFESEGVDEFDRFDLRTSQNGSWAWWADYSGCFVDDVFARDTMRALGEPYTRSRSYHLYINGQYWGLYETEERAESSFAASYLGDPEKDHYDALKNGLVDGTDEAWRELWNRSINYPLATPANYNRLLGLNPDGTRNPSYPILLDVTNLVHRYLVFQVMRDHDSPTWDNQGPNNNIMLYNRVNPDGFKFLLHDNDLTFGKNGLVSDDLTGWGSNLDSGVIWPDYGNFNPATLHLALTRNAEYRKVFSALVQKHLHNDGVLTPAHNVARFGNRMADIYNSICGESARWGRGINNYSSRTHTDWLNRCHAITNSFMQVRNDYVISQFKNRGWIPQVDAPEKRQTGRVHPVGTAIDVVAGNLFFYTLNGADPLLPDGSISIAAKSVLFPNPGTPSQTFVSRSAPWRYYDVGNQPPNNNSATWKDPAFNAATWASGPAVLGFGAQPVATTTKRYVNGVSGAQVTTTYFRHTFTVADASQINNLVAEMLCDDGAVVYLNGHEVARYNMNNGTPSYGTYSTTAAEPIDYFTYNIPVQYLQNGANVLAVEVHQCYDLSSDIYFDFSLKTVGNGDAGRYSATFPAAGRTTVMARAFNGTEWSELAEITFEGAEAAPPPAPVGTNFAALRMSKLMFSPVHATAAEVAAGALGPAGNDNARDACAWFELCNTDPVHALDMTGFSMANNITLNASVMEGIILPPGGRIFVAKNINSFNARYPNNTRRVVQWTSGNIARNGGNGKEFDLLAPDGSLLYRIWYDAEWFSRGARNTGLWINARDFAAPTSAYSTEAGWELSGVSEAPLVAEEGEPGDPPPPPVGAPDYSAIRVTRLMFAPPAPDAAELVAFPSYENDHYAWLELANTGDQPVNLNGYVMTNNISCKFNNVTLPPGGRYTVCKKKDGFDLRHPEGVAPNDSGRERKNWDNGNIARRGGPDKPFDFYAPDGTFLYSLTYSDTWLDGGAYNTGRWLKLKDWACPLGAMSTEAAWELEAPATVPARLSELVISEIHFAPHAERNYEQFIEFLNPGIGPLDLSGIQVSGSVSFTFPPGTYLAAGQTTVIVRHASEFAARYQDPASAHYYPGISVAGAWTGALPTTGNGTVTLTAADGTPIGSVTYSPSWYNPAAGNGSSLEVAAPFSLPGGKSESEAFLNTAAAWQPSALYRGSPGRVDAVQEPVPSPGIVINEVLSHPLYDGGRGDWVELFNTSDSAINLANVFLSDSRNDLLRMRLSGTLPPGGYAVFYPGDAGFGISELGETIIITETDGAGNILRTHDSVSVPAMERGETIGRFQITDGSIVFTELAAPTQGATNALPRIGPVVISELMVRPGDGKAEYIELTNITGSPVPLFHPTATTNTWTFSGLTFRFPENIILAPYETVLIVATNEVAFRQQYAGALPASPVRIFDQWTAGSLSNEGETIALLYPGDPESDGTVPLYRADWFTYAPDAPWPTLTRGEAYEKYPATAYGNDPVNWRNTDGGTPGTVGGIIDRIPDPSVRDALLAAIGEHGRTRFENWFRNKSGLASPADITVGILARVLNAYLCNIPYADWSDDLLKFVTPPVINGDGTVSATVHIGVMTFASNRLDVNGIDVYLADNTLNGLMASVPVSYADVRLDAVPGDATKMRLTVPMPSAFSGFLRICVNPESPE